MVGVGDDDPQVHIKANTLLTRATTTIGRPYELRRMYIVTIKVSKSIKENGIAPIPGNQCAT
jgi:hypothetical protein